MAKTGKTLCETATGEPYQPVRIYYEVHKKGAVLGRLKRLKCIEQDKGNRDRWNWYYKDEARSIKYLREYKDIPKELRPALLGYFEWRSPQSLELNVLSLQGVVKALDFFNRKINPNLASTERMRVVNRLFEVSEEVGPNRPHESFDQFMEGEQVFIPDPTYVQAKIAEIEEMYEGSEERQAAMDAFMKEDTSKPSHEFEEINFSLKDDVWESMLSVSLMLRQIEVSEHWKGNASFTQQDAINRLLEMTDGMS